MGNQQIRVNLMFDANVAAAKNNIQQLATLLQQVATPKTVTVNGGAIQQAAQAAQTLQMHLQNAMNVNTGKLDLTKLNFSLKQAGLSLNDLSAKLVASGAQGQQAFTKLANAIAQAGAPAAQLNATITKFMQTIGSAMMWSAAYGALEGVTNTIREAVDYAKDLNKALNDIAIVSDLSASQLDDFAVKAAKAAKTLNTTTTEYAKAALIFYQQGLSGKEVEERANVVTKLAQVTGESAQEVSDQLTAIWNNFNDGSKSLEYYADALTALGAATAASTDEITQGLEKFAAVSETVGLSYEYATAALATVVDKTRQSADVVGTAFKTLFARIGDLELGETLDDGVTLGKYSAALEAVGVNILTQNGELKDMDNILDELGSKWDNISKAQQTALAQTVAGTRQYTQFIAIMDNYKDFKLNVDIASGAEGTLTEQWKTWADSYEAAAKRVEQRKNELYEALLDDDFVIDITNLLADSIDMIGKVADAMGGLGPIILTILALFSNKLVPIIQRTATSFIQNFRVMSGAAQEESLKTQQATQAMLQSMMGIKGNMINDNDAIAQQYKLIDDLFTVKMKLAEANKVLSAAEKEEYLQKINTYEATNLELQKSVEMTAQLKKELEVRKLQIVGKNREGIQNAAKEHLIKTDSGLIEQRNKIMAAQKEVNSLQRKYDSYEEGHRQGQNQTYRALVKRKQLLEEELHIYEQMKNSMASQGPLSKQVVGTASFETVGYSTQGGDNIYQDEFAHQSLIKNNLIDSQIKLNDQGFLSPQNIDISVDSIIKMAEAQGQMEQKALKAKSALIEFESITKQLAEGKQPVNLKAFADSLNNLGITGEKAKEKIQQLQKDIKNLKPGSSTKEIAKELLLLANGAEDCAIDFSHMNSSMIKTFKQLIGGDAAFDKFIEDEVEASRMSAETAERIKQLGNEKDNLDAKMSRTTAATNIASQIGTMAGQISMAVSAVKMLGQAFDEDTSLGERFMSGLMAISMLLPIVTSLFNKDTSAKIRNSWATLMAAGAEKVSQGEKTKTNIITGIQILLQKLLNKELWLTIAPMLAIAGAALALVAVIGLVIGGIKLLMNWWNQDAIAAEKAATKANELTEAYKNTKQAYDELKESIADYGEAQLAIAKLKKGTEEWYEAIQKSNEQVMSLMEKYPELVQYVKSVDGQLKITDPQAILDIYRERTNTLQNTSLDANLAAKNAKNRVDRTEFIRNNGDFYEGEDWFNTIANRTGQGLAIGTAAGLGVGSVPVGAAMAGIGALTGVGEAIYNNANAGNIMDEALTKISEAYQEDSSIFANFEDSLDKLGITNQALRDSLIINKNAIYDLVKVEKAALDYEEFIAQQKVDNLLLSQGIFFGDNYTDNVQDLVKTKYKDEVSNKITTDFDSSEWHRGGWADWWKFGIHTATDTGEAKASEYATLMGYSNFETTDFTKDRVKFKYKKEGEDEYTETEATYEEMEKVLAEHAVATEDAVAKYASRINNTITSLSNSENALAQGVGSFLAEGDLDYTILTEDQRQALADGTLSAVFPSDEAAKQAAIDFGYDTVKNMTMALQQAAAEYDPTEAATNVARRTAQEINAIFEQAAAGLETTTDALALYSSSLMDTNPELEKNEKLAAQIAVQHFKTAKGLNTLQKTFKENAEVLKNADRSSIDYYEALGKLNQAIEETFGVKVSADFLENEENLKDLEKAANNDVEALARLKKAVNEDFILNLNINDDAKNALKNKISELSEQALNSPVIGTPLVLDDSQAIAALNEALYTGEATIEQIESMFNNANLQMPEYKTHWVDGEVTRSESTTTIRDPIIGKTWTMTSDTVTTAKKAIPYFGDSPPTVDQNTGKVTSYGGGGSLSIKTTGNSASNSDVLKYSGEDSTGGSKKEKKNVSEEVERYHVIDKTLERLEKEYDQITKAKDRAFGQKYLDYLDREIAKTNELADATRTKLAEAQKNLILDRDAMAKYGMATDRYGQITNYEEMIAAQVAQYNTNPEAYEDSYQEFMDNLAQYEETLALVQDLGLELDDYNYQMQDLALERIQYEVDLQVRLADNELARLEWQIDRLGDSIEDAADKFALMSQQIEISIRKADAARQGITSILDAHGLAMEQIEQASSDDTLNTLLADSNFTESEVAALEEYMNSLYEETANMEEYFDSFSEQMVATFEDMNEGFDKAIEKIDHMNSMMENFRSIIDLVGADTLGISHEMLEQLSKTQYELARNNVSIARSQLEQNQAALAALEQEIAEAQARGDERSVEELQEAYDEIYATVQENEQALLEATAAALEARRKLFEDEMNNIIKVFEQAMSGQYGSFSAMEQAYEQQKELSNLFLQDYEKIYELSKLTREITNSIDETDNIRAKERLRDIQEEINALQESNTQMTQFEVDELRARYEMRLAEIALEEAQNAKSRVRMQRDAAGNWGYVYTADEEAIDSAMQAYEDKMYAYQNLLNGHIEEMQDRLVSIPREYAEAVAAIYADQTLTDEERRLRIKETQDYYQAMYDYAVTEMGQTIDRSSTFYQEDWTAYSEMTGSKISDNDEWIDSFNETWYAQTAGFNTVQEALSAFSTASSNMLDGIEGAYANYQSDVATTLDTAGLDIETFSKKLAEYMQKAQAEAEELSRDMDQAADDSAQAFKDIVTAATTEMANYSAIIDKWVSETNRISTAINGTINTLAQLSAALEDIAKGYQQVANAQAGLQSGGVTGSVPSGPGQGWDNQGYSDELIKKAQIYLNNNHNAGLSVDGRWGERSQEAVKAAGLTLQDIIKRITASPFAEEEPYNYGQDTASVFQNRLKYTGSAKAVPVYTYSPSNDSMYYANKTITTNLLRGLPIQQVWKKDYYQVTTSGGKSYWVYAGDGFVRYDTGGYTGEWDSSGRLAMLHQKEIVLNAHDTANFLAAIDILRDITRAIDLQALSQTHMLSALTSASVGTAAQVIEQEVTIHAEFPNATNHSEIEEAFDTLLNRASQFANRKK